MVADAEEEAVGRISLIFFIVPHREKLLLGDVVLHIMMFEPIGKDLMPVILPVEQICRQVGFSLCWDGKTPGT